MSIALETLASILESLAPLELAGSWDNVGLLLPGGEERIRSILLTIDLTEAVADEAIARGDNLIVAYHPVLFGGAKRLSAARAEDRAVLKCISRSVAVYSPHSALDAASDGINDWLAGLLGPAEIEPIIPVSEREGEGRFATLREPLRLAEALSRLARDLGAPHLRAARALAHSDDSLIRTFAVGAGASGSILSKGGPWDLVITGEMRHHDVLALRENGTTVVLGEHTGTERGYLPVLAERIRAGIVARGAAAIPICCAESDQPLISLIR